MVRKGYSKNFTVAVTAISSTIGIIIPPSIPMVVIAGICGISTGKLFLGGIIPGVLCGLAQMIVSYFMAKKEGVPKEPGHFTIGPVLHGLWESWPALLMPIIIVGTITMGIVSPTEAGVIAVVTVCLPAASSTANSSGRTSSLPLQRPSAPAAVSSSLSALQSCTPSC